MITRRDFIGAAGAMASAAFVGCDLLAPAHVHAQGAPVRRREVVVNGRRVKRSTCMRTARFRKPWR
jgi:hypothetical protein